MKVQTLSFDEEIILDCSNMPFDDTEGAQERDIALTEALYSWSSDLDDTLEYADIIHVEGPA